jgi:hypothetical protein
MPSPAQTWEDPHVRRYLLGDGEPPRASRPWLLGICSVRRWHWLAALGTAWHGLAPRRSDADRCALFLLHGPEQPQVTRVGSRWHALSPGQTRWQVT